MLLIAAWHQEPWVSRQSPAVGTSIFTGNHWPSRASPGGEPRAKGSRTSGPEAVKEAAPAHPDGRNQSPRPGVPDCGGPWRRTGSGPTGGGTGIEPDRRPWWPAVPPNCCTTLMGPVDPGDEVIVFEPSYDAYRTRCRMAGGQVRTVPLRAAGLAFRSGAVRGCLRPAHARADPQHAPQPHRQGLPRAPSWS